MEYSIKTGGINLHLLVSGPERTSGNLNVCPLTSSEIIHFLQVTHKKEDDSLDFHVISYGIGSGVLCGPCSIDAHANNMLESDVLRYVHQRVFSPELYGLSPEDEITDMYHEILLNEDGTTFVSCLPCSLWMKVWKSLSKRRNELIISNSSEESGATDFSYDAGDKMLCKTINRVNMVLSAMLYNRNKASDLVKF